jgi:hypothetical protein
MARRPLMAIARLSARLMVAVLALLATAVISAADPPSRYDNGPRQEIAAARSAWKATSPPNYRFTVTQTCFCLIPPVVVTVRNGKVSKAVMARGLEHRFSGKALPPGEWRRYFALPVPELLDVVDAVLRDRTLYSTARFDPSYGFPIRLDLQPGSPAPADTESGFVIASFRVE